MLILTVVFMSPLLSGRTLHAIRSKLLHAAWIFRFYAHLASNEEVKAQCQGHDVECIVAKLLVIQPITGRCILAHWRMLLAWKQITVLTAAFRTIPSKAAAMS